MPICSVEGEVPLIGTARTQLSAVVTLQEMGMVEVRVTVWLGGVAPALMVPKTSASVSASRRGTSTTEMS